MKAKVFQQFKSDLWGPAVMHQADKVQSRLEWAHELISDELIAHKEALSEGSRYAGSFWNYRPVMTREEVRDVEAALNELGSLKFQIGALENGPSDVSEVSSKMESILERIAPMTRRFRAVFMKPEPLQPLWGSSKHTD